MGPVAFKPSKSDRCGELGVALEVEQSGLFSSLELKDNKLAFRVALHFSAEGFRELGGRSLVLEFFSEVEGKTIVAGGGTVFLFKKIRKKSKL